MKTKVFFCLFFIFVFASISFPQSVVIKSKKVIYKRTGRNVPDFKRKFEVNYPVIKSKLTRNIKKNLQNTIDYWRVFDTPLEENLKDNHWLTNFDYRISYNQNYILSIILMIEGVGAYPDSANKYFVVDLKTGKQVGIRNIFKKNLLTILLAKIRKAIRHRENITRKESSCFAETIDFQRESEVSREFYPVPEKIGYKDLNGVFVTDKGVTFLYDYNFAHVVQACEPDQEYFFSWIELKPFIERDGLLGKFIR